MFRNFPAESRIEVLDDPNIPIRVVGGKTEDLGCTLMLAADAEGALLVRVLDGGGLGLEVGGSLRPGG